MLPAIDKLRCPLCAGDLHLDNKSYNRSIKCEQNHSFDFAKQGYVNLLLANQKHSKDPGDGPEMIAARDRFHSQDHYRRLGQEVSKHLHTSKSLLDLGCGEGSYGDWLLAEHPSLSYYGFDISRHGVKRAASRLKQYGSSQKPQPTCVVASNFALPIKDDGFDAILSVFAPVSEPELARVLKPSGLWINVSPGSNHLKELRQALYDDVTEIEKHKTLDGWTIGEETNLSYQLVLGQADIRDLVTMTPYAWQAKQDKREAVCDLAELTLSVDFKIECRQKITKP